MKKRVTKEQAVRTELLEVEHSDKTTNLITRVVGMSAKKATDLAESLGKIVRITREDNSYHIGTPEFNPNRLNIEVEKGIVVRSAIG